LCYLQYDDLIRAAEFLSQKLWHSIHNCHLSPPVSFNFMAVPKIRQLVINM
jgi:hypothetical protein